MTSMFHKASKAQAKARIGLCGPTGAGKTWDALIWATALGDKVALIDTERGSASLYSPHFDFDTIQMSPPYDPARLVTVLKAAESEGYEVVVIDSLTHFWQGEGGTLDIVDAAAERARGNSYAGWKIGTPALRNLVDTILGLDAHVIATMRSKMEYVLEEDSRGKKVPKKVGMAPIMRDGVEYEFTLVGDIDLEHRIVISKSRCVDLADQVIQKDRVKDAAVQFRNWLGEGDPVADRKERDDLVARMDGIEDPDRRKACKQAWMASFGRPEGLLASQVDEADFLVAQYEMGQLPAKEPEQPALVPAGEEPFA